MGETLYSIGEIAAKAGVTTRTVRYYVAEGILPSPTLVGKYARYGEKHLHRLDLILRLKASYLPLPEIREQLNALSDAEIAALLSKCLHKDEVPAESRKLELSTFAASQQSGAAYVEHILAVGGQLDSSSAGDEPVTRPKVLLVSGSLPSEQDTAAPGVPIATARTETWEHIVLEPGVELHVRAGVSDQTKTKIQRVIKSFGIEH